MRLTMLAISLFLLTGCIPCSEQPLSMPGQDELDARLFGTWRLKNDNGTVFIHFGHDKSSGLLKVAYIEFRKSGEMELIEFAGHNTNSGNFRYLNLKWIHPANDCPGYLPVKYALNGTTLEIGIASASAIEEAIRKGELRGEISKSLTILKDEPEKMREYFEQHDGELFPDMGTLEKMEASAPR